MFLIYVTFEIGKLEATYALWDRLSRTGGLFKYCNVIQTYPYSKDKHARWKFSLGIDMVLFVWWARKQLLRDVL